MSATCGDGHVDQLVASWLQVDPMETSRSEILQLQEKGDIEELLDRLEDRLQFGTAGLRGLDGAGFNRMNQTTVQQTTQGLFEYVKDCFGMSAVQGRGVVIGFDARMRSQEYAETVAKVFLEKGVRVCLFSKIVPTPFVAFGVVHLECVAGIMITASHNPKDYNGYKLYWENGCQIIPPQDSKISSCIEDSLQLWDLAMHNVATSTLVEDPMVSVSDAYFTAISKHLHFKPVAKSKKVLVYSPLHGVGGEYIEKAFAAFGISPPIMVPEQEDPDPTFPTVSFPNPEEGAHVFQLAFETADKNGASLILMNDPDADRLAVAEKIDREWKILSGNEIGLVLGKWIWDNVRKINPGIPAENYAMIGTVVSSKMLSRLAHKEGFQYFHTLTGFKWLGNKAIELRKSGLRVLLAFEEAIGFMLEGPATDKDGVSAAATFAEMALSLHSQGMTVHGYLREISLELGQLEYRSGSFHQSPKDAAHIFECLRDTGYPKELAGFVVEWVRDMGKGIDTSRQDGLTDLPWKKGDLMITFGLEQDGWITLRASGTEPKLKYYLEIGNVKGMDASTAAKHLEEVIKDIVK